MCVEQVRLYSDDIKEIANDDHLPLDIYVNVNREGFECIQNMTVIGVKRIHTYKFGVTYEGTGEAGTADSYTIHVKPRELDNGEVIVYRLVDNTKQRGGR